jgi:hypothetical protein
MNWHGFVARSLIAGTTAALLGCGPRAEIEPLYAIDDFFDHSYINNNIARGKAFFGNDRYRFFSYFDTQGRVQVLRYDRRGGEWLRGRVDERFPDAMHQTASLHNPHNFISGGLDVDGRIHLLFGAHNSNARHYISRRPLDPSEWVDVSEWIIRVKHHITYPSLLQLPQGDLWLLYRHGRAGNGSTYLVRGLSLENLPSEPQRLIDGRQENSQYLFSPVVTRHGCVHIAWTWRLSDFAVPSNNPYLRSSFQGVTNRDIAYARSCDGGQSWTDARGGAKRLPLVRRGDPGAVPEVITEIDIGTGFFNHYGSDVDGGGNPHFVLHRWDDARITQIWHLFSHDKRWHLQQVSDYRVDIPWNRHQVNGLAATALARPEIVVSPETSCALIITRSQHHGNQLELYRSCPPYDIWALRLIPSGSLGGWEPQLDKLLFHAEQRLVLALNVVWDRPAYEAYGLVLDDSERDALERRAAGDVIAYRDYSILFPINAPPLDMTGAQFSPGEAWIAEVAH